MVEDKVDVRNNFLSKPLLLIARAYEPGSRIFRFAKRCFALRDPNLDSQHRNVFSWAQLQLPLVLVVLAHLAHARP